MENELENEKYKELLQSMCDLSEQMPEIILTEYFDNKKYLHALYFDVFNSVRAFCVLLDNGCLISQACTVLRMLIEQAATIHVIETNNDNLYNEYVRHQRFRLQIADKDNNEKRELIKKKFEGELCKEDNPIVFLEYGWLKIINEKYGLDELIRVSKIQPEDDAFINWKNQLNLWVHGSIKSLNIFHDKTSVEYCNQLTLIVAKILDNLICDFHNETKFNFEINGVNYRKKFIDAYKVTC